MAEVIDISDSDEEAAAAEEEEEAAEAAPEATESLTPQAGRPLVDELDLVDSQRGLKCAICALHNLLQQACSLKLPQASSAPSPPAFTGLRRRRSRSTASTT